MVNLGWGPAARGETEKKEGVLIRTYNELKLRILLTFNAFVGGSPRHGSTSRLTLLQPLCQRQVVEKRRVFRWSGLAVRCIVHRCWRSGAKRDSGFVQIQLFESSE